MTTRGIVSAQLIFHTAPFPSCHAATLLDTADGLLAAWFGGTREGNPDVCIWTARFDGLVWSSPQKVAERLLPLSVLREGRRGEGWQQQTAPIETPPQGSTQSAPREVRPSPSAPSQRTGSGREPCWNPVLFQPRGGPVMLFYKVGPSPSKWWGMLIKSEDSGRTWGPPSRLQSPLLGPAKNKPVQLADGTIICPCSAESEAGWRIYFESSKDNGSTFTAGEFVDQDAGLKCTQPSILIHSPQDLQAIGRTTSGRLFETWSNDSGRTWSKIALMDLPNCNSGIDAVTILSPCTQGEGKEPALSLSKGEGSIENANARGLSNEPSPRPSPGVPGEGAATCGHLLVYNHSNIEKVRYPLCAAISRDGRLWQAALELESEPPGQYSYPAVIQSRDGLVHVAYTWKRRSIKHVVIDPAQLQPRPLSAFTCPPPGSPTHRADEFQ